MCTHERVTRCVYFTREQNHTNIVSAYVSWVEHGGTDKRYPWMSTDVIVSPLDKCILTKHTRLLVLSWGCFHYHCIHNHAEAGLAIYKILPYRLFCNWFSLLIVIVWMKRSQIKWQFIKGHILLCCESLEVLERVTDVDFFLSVFVPGRKRSQRRSVE